MQKETLGTWQSICVLFLFILGGTVVNLTGKAEQDMWVSVLLALVFAVPICLLYGRILQLFPAMSLFETMESLFGRAAGKCLSALFLLYAVINGGTALRQSGEFSKITAMQQTPLLVLILAVLLVVVHLTKSGGEVFGRFSVILFPVIIGVFALSLFASLRAMRTENLQPVLDHKMTEILDSTWGFWANPLAETVLLLGMGGMIKRDAKPYRIYFLGILIATATILINMLRTLMILGFPYNAEALFPQYVATRIIDVGGVVTRIEGITSGTFYLVAIAKAAVCVYVTAFGLCSLFGFQTPNLAVLPSCLLVFAMSYVSYNSIQEVLRFLKLYRYFAAPFQLLLPLAVWISAECKIGRWKRNPGQGAAESTG